MEQMEGSSKLSILQVLKYSGALVGGLICVSGAYMMGRYHPLHKHEPVIERASVRQNEEIENILKGFALERIEIDNLMNFIVNELDKGLDTEDDPTADLKMIPTYIQHLPDGSERGQILAIDLGGTNYRVYEIPLTGAPVRNPNTKTFVLPESVRQGPGDQLFAYLARCIVNFMRANDLVKPRTTYPLGFAFSFPCKQSSLTSGTLVSWTKDFRCADVVGTDVVDQLNAAMSLYSDVSVKCEALINDTVGALMSCASTHRTSYVGAIFGTGTNACYVERLDRVHKWKPESTDGPDQVIINTEWGGLGDNGGLDFVRTDYDKKLDRESKNPGKQIFEKMISGLYLGELARLILVDLIERQLLFPGVMTKSPGESGNIGMLFREYNFGSSLVGSIEEDNGIEFAKTKDILEDFGFKNPSYEDCSIVKSVCERVSMRASVLSASALAVLLNRIGKPEITVGIDGTFFRYHPRFKHNMISQLASIVDRHIKYQLVLNEEGSGIGAALVAAVAERIRNNPEQASNYKSIYDDNSRESTVEDQISKAMNRNVRPGHALNRFGAKNYNTTPSGLFSLK